MYAADSFFTLGPWEQAGLAALSLAMAAGLVLVLRPIARKADAGRLLRAGLALTGFWGFLWLSPQVYYTYYQAIIPGLPWQVVVGWPPGPIEVASLMGFRGDPSLADHARGALGWVLLGWALVIREEAGSPRGE